MACIAILLALPALSTPVRAAVDVNLLGRMNLPNSVFLTSAIIHEDAGASRLYAFVGDDFERIYVVDVTDPTDMRLVAQIPGVPGFDLRIHNGYLYACDGNQSGQDSRIIDIADPANPVVLPNGFPSAHNLQVSPGGLLFAEFPGLRLFDLADPTAPALLYQTGGEGHDCAPRGNRLYDFHGRDGAVIWDITDPASPDTLGVIHSPDIRFYHSGDVTADERYLYLCDELMTGSGADVTVWDIQDPAGAFKVGQISDSDATVHNVYVVGDMMYVAYYAAGFKVFDLADPEKPVLAGQYDTSRRSGDGFIGAIDVFAYSPDGNFYVIDIENGLFAFSVTPAAAAAAPDPAPFHLSQNAPNPFNPATTIPFELTRADRVQLDVFDVAGRRVRALLDGQRAAGLHQAAWDGRDDAGRAVASGVYFYRLQAAGRVETRRMLLLK
jgi:hypothetical protein